MDWIQAIDNAVTLWVYSMRQPWLDGFMVWISRLNDATVLWFIVTVVLLCFKRTRRCGIACLWSLLITIILNEMVVKPWINRPRPFAQLEGLTMLIRAPRSFSFPSGHTATSFAAAAAIFCNNRKLGWAAYVVAALIGFSRIYLSVHFLTDVLGGIVLGTLCAMAGVWISRKMGKRVAKN